jgi:hypothetical protein
MTSGSRPEMIGSSRLIVGLHDVQAWSILGDEVDDAREGFGCRCLVGPTLLRR